MKTVASTAIEPRSERERILARLRAHRLGPITIAFDRLKDPKGWEGRCECGLTIENRAYDDVCLTHEKHLSEVLEGVRDAAPPKDSA